MIEIIREETCGGTTERRGLPKDIKQMGNPDIGDRIYVENEVYQFLHSYRGAGEKRAYVLLGKFENHSGRACVFVEAAILLEDILFDGDLPRWNDSTWAYIYNQLKKEYDDMSIVGWALDIKGQMPSMTMRLETLHQSNFGGEHQILLLMDSLENEETFYGNKEGHLCRREGFYVYYKKRDNVYAQEEMTYAKNEKTEPYEVKNEPVFRLPYESEGQETLSQGKYRGQMKETGTRRGVSGYMSTVMLVLVVCVLGFSAYWNNEKMKTMEETLAQMKPMQNAVTETKVSEVKVENIDGSVAKLEEEASETTAATEVEVPENIDSSLQNESLAQETETPEMAATETAEVIASEAEVNEQKEEPEKAAEVTDALIETRADAQTYLSQGYYIVQKGDSLVGICKSIYQTTAMMDKLCEVNEIENQNEIYAGQKLILPN